MVTGNKVWTKDFRLPNIPGLNHLDFSLWAHLKREGCLTIHTNLSSLKEAITRSWEEMSEEYVVMTCQVVKIQIKKIIEENSDYME